MQVTFYKNTSDPRKVSKKIVQVGSPITCQIKEQSSLINPVIEIKSSTLANWINANYAYIDTFNRYYYVDNIVQETAQRVLISLKCDVLMSNQSGIRQLSCTIKRQENIYSKYLGDEELPTRAQKTIAYINLGQLPIASSIVLTVDGGKQGD